MASLVSRIKEFINGNCHDFNQLAMEIFADQYNLCQPYQKYCNNLGKNPATLSTWEEIPAISTEVFRVVDLSIFPISQAQHIFYTSGTSQTNPGKHYYEDLSLYDAAIYNSFLHGIGLSDDVSCLNLRILTPSFADHPHSSLCYMLSKIVAWYGSQDSKFYYKNQNLDCVSLVRDLRQDCLHNRPVVIIGTAFALANFIDYLVRNDELLCLPSNSRLLETGGLKGRTRDISRVELYKSFSKYLGLNERLCFSEYGMTELSSQCYSLANSHCFIAPPWMPVRIIDVEHGTEVALGETGLVQFFDTANYTAISAILTADLARREEFGFTLLGRAPQAVLRGCSLYYES